LVGGARGQYSRRSYITDQMENEKWKMNKDK
jgi:hypothetical protein